MERINFKKIKYSFCFLIFLFFLFPFLHKNINAAALPTCYWYDIWTLRCGSETLLSSSCNTFGCACDQRPNYYYCCYCQAGNARNCSYHQVCRYACNSCRVSGSWYNVGCGSCGCSSSQMCQYLDSRLCYNGGLCGRSTRCVASSSCRTCNCGSWNNSSCGAYSCPSNQRGRIQYCYWSDGSGLCDTNTSCVSDSSCVSCTCSSYTDRGCGQGGCSSSEMYQTRTCTPSGCSSQSRCVSTSSCLPDCGNTCLDHGAAGVGWPNCSCSNQTPASGYERIGTWNSSDCSSCTGYRRQSCSCSSWSNGSCGGGSCSPTQRQQTRTCSPSGCDSTSRCVSDSSCCSCGSWSNQGCGQGGCPLNRMYRTRTCSPSGCDSTSDCDTNSSCNSSCTISLSPSPFTAYLGENSLLTASVNPTNATVSQVNFSSNNSSIASVSPASDNDTPYRTYVYGNQLGSAIITAIASLSPEGSCTATVPVTVESSAWFQTQGGDVYSGGDLQDIIPESANVTWVETDNDRSMSLELDNWPGMITHQAEEVRLGSGYPSLNTDSHWLSKSLYEGKSYGSSQFFKKKFAMKMEPVNFPASIDSPPDDGFYYIEGDKNLGGSWNIARGSWIILLIEGNVNINTDIRVSLGGFLAIVSTGSIIFSDNVVNAQGMFIADQNIDTGSGVIAFSGEGIFSADGFSLGRNFGDLTNRTTPIETFKARPDFIMSSYKDANYNVWWFFQKWQEIAP